MLQSWDGWLRKVTLQVKAAVDLSRGLQGSKLKRLDGILATDMVHPFSLPVIVPPACCSLVSVH
jgi:hypothetical protein